MIDLYTWSTPNGRKISILLEELGLPYRAHAIDITRGQEFTPEFLAINPNAKIPAIIDHEGPAGKPITLFESGAILIYLAEKRGQYLANDPRTRYLTLQWLMFQMGGVGPIFGQAHHFLKFAPQPVPYAIERFTTETRRLYGVLEQRLSDAPYLADAYSIADIATYPWVARHEWHSVNLVDFPKVKDWFERISLRPAVAKGMVVPA
ncbi:MAG: glutathione S-transferase N-terminal domain-containing protein [Burkholderiales bacterium]|nr:glutathione S-transferase N-terminal domain-containing protein [Burkholderiales bacterium]